MSRPSLAGPLAPWLLGAALLAGCAATRPAEPAHARRVPDVAITRAGSSQVHVEFKETLDEPYAYLEVGGTHAEAARGLEQLLEHAERQALEPAGPLFTRFSGDPRRATPGTRARVGFAVAAGARVEPPLALGTWEAATVVYAVLEGPFGSGPSAYPALYERIASWGWAPAGPVREIYAFPEDASRPLLTEVQVPWVPRR